MVYTRLVKAHKYRRASLKVITLHGFHRQQATVSTGARPTQELYTKTISYYIHAPPCTEVLRAIDLPLLVYHPDLNPMLHSDGCKLRHHDRWPDNPHMKLKLDDL